MAWDRRKVLATSASGIGLVSIGGMGLWAANRDNPQVGPLPRGDGFPNLPIGMNLANIADWEPGFPFRNLFLGARPWLTRNLSGKGPFNTNAQEYFRYDPNGYPLEVPVNVAGIDEPQTVFTFLPQPRKSGRHVLLYDGDGELSGLSSVKVIQRRPGRLVLHLEADEEKKQVIAIKRSNPENHVRNLRLVPEDEEAIDLAAYPFIPEFLEFCRPFHCLRFMEWGKTNNSLQENWSDRKRPNFYTMVGKDGDPEGTWRKKPTAFDRLYAGGVAYEYMIQLCNMLKTDMWVCVPHRATDDYIAQLARLVRDNLDPSLKVYLEYSNEVWNWGFVQAQWMLKSPLAGALVEAKGGFPWKNAARTEGKDHPERIGALFRRTFEIWEREWEKAHDRLIRVCSVQVGWADASQRTLRWCVENGGADAVSPAAYIGATKEIYKKWELAGQQLTADAVIDDMFELLLEKRSSGNLLEIISYARRKGLTYVAYEGGQGIQPERQAEHPYNAAIAAAQAHPRMYDLYIELLGLHRDLDCRMLGHFSSVGKQGTRWGSWGAKASYLEPNETSPKMRALLACNSNRR